MGINRDLFKDYFGFQAPTFMLKALLITNDKKKNNDLVNAIRNRLKDLEEEIEDMSEYQIKIENIEKMVDIVEELLDFNRQNQNQKGEGLKILTPEQSQN